MRILQVVPYFPPAYAFGGPAQVVYQISRALQKRGHEVVVYTTDARDFASRLNSITIDTHDGIVVHRFRNLSMSSVRRFKLFITPGLISKVKNDIRSFDIVHLHEYRTLQNVVVHRYARRAGVPYIMQAHGSIARVGSWKRLKLVFDSLFGFRILKDSSSLIALSQMEAEQYRNVGVPEEKIAIIPNGIDLSEYAKLPPKGQFKKKFSIPADKKIVLYLGRIHKTKGIDLLVKAYAYLTKKMNFKDAVLVIVGPDDGYLSDVESLVQSLGVSSSVLFTGPLYGRDKLETYVDSDVYVLPSRYETFPMGLLEAYACEKPVIASNVGGLKGLVINGETGLLFETGNVEQLADRLLYLLNHLNQETKDMGKKAKGFVEERYSIEKVIDKLESLYEEIAVR